MTVRVDTQAGLSEQDWDDLRFALVAIGPRSVEILAKIAALAALLAAAEKALQEIQDYGDRAAVQIARAYFDAAGGAAAPSPADQEEA